MITCFLAAYLLLHFLTSRGKLSINRASLALHTVWYACKKKRTVVSKKGDGVGIKD